MPYSRTSFDFLPSHPSGTVSYIHIGDAHITIAGEENEIALGRIVDEINAVYATGGIDFVFIPGDVAERGDAAAYEVFRRHLDRLRIPWFGIVGDHDVHERSFGNFKQFVSSDLYSAFSVAGLRFLRLNAFSEPRPDGFRVDAKQLAWLEAELQSCEKHERKAVLFLHCYPSDLKHGGPELAELLHRYPVLLVDMGHTHYNEISNDGEVLYSATRSTGQIEEGPAGYSITTIDEGVVSWHFVELGSPALVAITHPADSRLITRLTGTGLGTSVLRVRAKAWADTPVVAMHAKVAGLQFPLERNAGLIWSGEQDLSGLGEGSHLMEVTAIGTDGKTFASTIRLQKGSATERRFAAIDQENSIGEWKERGILGTQLGPNKNGRKW